MEGKGTAFNMAILQMHFRGRISVGGGLEMSKGL